MRTKLPEYLKRSIIDTDKTKEVRKILKVNCLNTVCENARCPNKNECYTKHTATFLIMGNYCTRNCRYCNISCAKPESLDANEPKRIAQAVKALGLKYAVITSVTRDDLPDGGAKHFADCINQIRELCHETKIEILTPDFKNDKHSLDIIIRAHPDVFNHNIETVKEIFKKARPQGNYENSLAVLKYIKENSDIKTKSGRRCAGNHGSLSRAPESKLFAELLGVRPENVFIGGSASLQLMYDTIAKAYTHGRFNSDQPWSWLEKVKWICPVPGYDRHFTVSQSFGMEMINVPMTDAGATFPYGTDPQDSNIRVAPSLPSTKQLEQAMEIFCTAMKLAALNKLLEA